MIELRWVLHWEEDSPNVGVVKAGKTLQYRVIEPVMFESNGFQYESGREDWSEWRDVPTVEETA